MKNQYYLIPFLLLAIVFLSACNDSSLTYPNITGKAGEVVLIIEKKDMESDLGKKFKEILLANQPGLPQNEPMFDLIDIPGQAFKSIFKTHRNLIFIDISAQNKEAVIVVDKDVYARPQTVITLKGNSSGDIVDLLEEKRVQLIDVLVDAERQRIMKNYSRYEEKRILNTLQKKHKLSMHFPKGYTLDLDTSNFIWLAYETPQISQGVFIYYYEYSDTSNFNLDTLLYVKDSLLKLYVGGPLEGSYMTTERVEMYPRFDEFYLHDKYVAEIRGLWRTHGDFMGGPFISLSMVDEKHNRLVTVDGYVYAPKFDKRNYLRQVEAILYSLTFPEEKNINPN